MTFNNRRAHKKIVKSNIPLIGNEDEKMFKPTGRKTQ